MFDKLTSNLSSDIGIDLGSNFVRVFVRGSGIKVVEHSYVAFDKNENKIKRFGDRAKAMKGRTTENIEVFAPLQDGVIKNYDITLKMIQYFIHKACGNTIIKPRVMISIPAGVTDVEERAIVDAALQAGARQAHLIDEPIAAALGAGLKIDEPNGKMIIDIGGATTDIAVISLGGVVESDSVKIAGNAFDIAIQKFVRMKHRMIIGESTAETIKKQIGSVCDHKDPQTMVVRGMSCDQGLPMTATLSSVDMLQALTDPITAIFDHIYSVIEHTPPELIGDILNNGIVLTGGGALLGGIDVLISNVLGIKTRLAKDPMYCVAYGTGISLNEWNNSKKMPFGF